MAPRHAGERNQIVPTTSVRACVRVSMRLWQNRATDTSSSFFFFFLFCFNSFAFTFFFWLFLFLCPQVLAAGEQVRREIRSRYRRKPCCCRAGRRLAPGKRSLCSLSLLRPQPPAVPLHIPPACWPSRYEDVALCLHLWHFPLASIPLGMERLGLSAIHRAPIYFIFLWPLMGRGDTARAGEIRRPLEKTTL